MSKTCDWCGNKEKYTSLIHTEKGIRRICLDCTSFYLEEVSLEDIPSLFPAHVELIENGERPLKTLDEG